MTRIDKATHANALPPKRRQIRVLRCGMAICSCSAGNEAQRAKIDTGYKMTTDGTEIYRKPLGGYQVTIKRGTFAGWVGLVYGEEFEHRKKIQAQTREEVKIAISKIIDADLHWL